MRHYVIGLLTLLAIASLLPDEALAQKKTVPSGASIFITEMQGDLDGFLRAELTKKKIPLTIVLDMEEAHLILTAEATIQEKRAWHEGWLSTSRDHALGSAMIIDRTTKKLLWVGEAGDRSLWWGGLARGGQRKVASRLADQIKDAIYVSPIPLPPPPPLTEEERAVLTQPAQPITGKAPLPQPPPPTQPAAESGAAEKQKPMTNEDVIKLVNAGIGEDVIIAKVRASEPGFQLEADDLVALKQAGVSDRILAAMMEPRKK